jgi:antitoxin component YwqK of YwqJK toxin-antitoxin module
VLKNKPYIVKWNSRKLELSPHKYFLKPVKFDILEGDTVNYFDMYGFKQGIHLDFNGENKIVSRLIYKNDLEIEGFEFRKYYDTGEIESETLLKNKREFKRITYFRNGKIKKECSKNRCREFDENGKFINEYDL